MQDPAYHNPRTRKALDELADMLLTGPVPIASPFVGGKSPSSGNGNAGGNSHAPGDSLKLHRGDTQRPTPPVLEAVLLGNLPGFATPWITQYVDMLSRISGATALVKIADSAVELDLFGEPQMLDAFRREHGRVTDFADALAAVAECAGEYAMLVGSPESDFARRRLAEVDRWTVLTAANDQAIVGAYRLIKSLLVDAAIPPPPHGVRVSVMGAAEDAATAAAERIAKAAASFLKITVVYAGSRKQMAPVRPLAVGKFDLGQGVDPWIVVHGFFQPPDQPLGRRAGDDASDLVSAEELDALAAFDAGDDFDRVDADADPPAATAPAAEPVTPVHPIDAELEQRLIRSLEDSGPKQPTPTPMPEPVVADAPTLASYLDAGRPLEARCPHHPQVEIAAGAGGRLHLALRIADAGSDVGAASNMLKAVHQWAAAHAPLLMLTDRAAMIDPAAVPVCHLFTDRPRTLSRLGFAGLIDGEPIRLHLLKPITVDGKTLYLHEPLS